MNATFVHQRAFVNWTALALIEYAKLCLSASTISHGNDNTFPSPFPLCSDSRLSLGHPCTISLLLTRYSQNYAELYSPNAAENTVNKKAIQK